MSSNSKITGVQRMMMEAKELELKYEAEAANYFKSKRKLEIQGKEEESILESKKIKYENEDVLTIDNETETQEQEIIQPPQLQPQNFSKSTKVRTTRIGHQGIWGQRIAYELQQLQRGDAPWGILAEMMDDDILLWSVGIRGPIGSAFEGGLFKGTLQFNKYYPYQPPTFTFISTVFHPNVGENGQVCVDRLYKEWSPCHTVWSLLLSVQFILADPNPGEALNDTASLYFFTCRDQYDEIVKECVEKTKCK